MRARRDTSGVKPVAVDRASAHARALAGMAVRDEGAYLEISGNRKTLASYSLLKE
jgi:hypothetical protein